MNFIIKSKDLLKSNRNKLREEIGLWQTKKLKFLACHFQKTKRKWQTF